MVVLCRPVVVVSFWLPALRSNLSLCMCRPVYACVVSMTVPVSFIAITVLVLIDLLTVLRCGCPRVTDECSFFFSYSTSWREAKGGPKKGMTKKWPKLPFLLPHFHPHCPQITAKFWANLLQRWNKLQIGVMIFYIPQTPNNSCHIPHVLLSSHEIWTTV